MSATLERRSPKHGPRVLRALVVDDNEPDVVMIERLLRARYGREIEIQQVETAEEASALLDLESFDVALIDYRLPDRSGLELVAEITAREQGPATILLTGQGSEAIAAQAIKRGAKDYLVKQDLTVDSLARVIDEAITAAPSGRSAPAVFEKLRRDHAELGSGVRSLSHDMTATFMVLQNSFERLRSSAGDSSMGDMVEGMSHVDACLRQSKEFLDDLRALAKSGAVEMAPTRVDLARVIEEVRYELGPLLAERGVELVVESGLGAVSCQETRVKQIISNLVRNAVRHGCDSIRPRISIGRRSVPGDGYVWLAVQDNGPGVPANQREEIFLPGRRLNPDKPGTGMGLAIVKKIIAYYGGTVFVESAKDGGAAFVFSLPSA